MTNEVCTVDEGLLKFLRDLERRVSDCELRVLAAPEPLEFLNFLVDLERRVAECEHRLPITPDCIRQSLTNTCQENNAGFEDILTKLNGKPKDFL